MSNSPSFYGSIPGLDRVAQRVVALACQGNSQGALNIVAPCCSPAQMQTIQTLIRSFDPIEGSIKMLEDRIVKELHRSPLFLKGWTPELCKHIVQVQEQSHARLQARLKEFIANTFSNFHILEEIVPCLDPRATIALSCASRSFNHYVPECISPEIAFKICGPRVRVINPGSVEIPSFCPFNLVKGCHTLASLVEGKRDAPLTFLIMPKGLTLRKIVTIAAENGIPVNIRWSQILREIGDISIEEAYVILMTNNVFEKSRNDWNHERFCSALRCKMPSALEYVVLCVFTELMFGESLYGRDPLTYGRSSTCVRGYPVLVGGSSPTARLRVGTGGFCNRWYYGVGGRREL
jgi:hypothetical protein